MDFFSDNQKENIENIKPPHKSGINPRNQKNEGNNQ